MSPVATVRVDTRQFDAFRRGWSKKTLQDLEIVMRAEGFRVMGVMREQAATGGQGTYRAIHPLTLWERYARHRGVPPISPLARAILYSFDKATFTVEVGFTGYRSMAGVAGGLRITPALARKYLAVLEGSSHTITREEQRRIAIKLRQRLGQPVWSVHGPLTKSKTQQRGAFRKKFGPAGGPMGGLPVPLPRVGTVVRFPRRNVLEDVYLRERDRIVRNIQTNFALRQAGLGHVSVA